MNQTFFINGVLPGLNEIIKAARSHRGKWQAYDDMKSSYGQYIKAVIQREKIKPVVKANFVFTWVEKNLKRDKDNVRVGAKFILDALVEAKILENDGWTQVGTIMDCFEVNKDKPGVRVEIVEI